MADDPKGDVSAEQLERINANIKKGLSPFAGEEDDSSTDNEDEKKKKFTIGQLANAYLNHHEERWKNGDISPRTFHTLYGTCATVVEHFGKTRAVATLKPNDFGNLRAKLAKKRKAVSLRNEMQRVRSLFKFAFDNELISHPVAFGTKFEKPKLKTVRRERREHREEHGDRMFTADELRLMLDYLDGQQVEVGVDAKTGKPINVQGKPKPALKAMVLLGVNCGFGQTDLARLPQRCVDLEHSTIDFPRPKTETDRICPLWPETVAAIQDWLPKCPKAKDSADAGLLFLTVRGARWVKTGENGTPIDGIGQEFNRMLRKLKLKRTGLSFYGLRHTFRTIADETLDPVSIDLIMGHTDNSMAANYRERVRSGRLKRVAEHVRQWLFAQLEQNGSPLPVSGNGKAVQINETSNFVIVSQLRAAKQPRIVKKWDKSKTKSACFESARQWAEEKGYVIVEGGE